MSAADSIWANRDNRASSSPRQQSSSGTQWNSIGDSSIHRPGLQPDQAPSTLGGKVGLSPDARPWRPSRVATPDQRSHLEGNTNDSETIGSDQPTKFTSAREEAPLERPTWTTHVPWETDDLSNSVEKSRAAEMQATSPIPSGSAENQSEAAMSTDYQQRGSMPTLAEPAVPSLENTSTNETESESQTKLAQLPARSESSSPSSPGASTGAEVVKPVEMAPETSSDTATSLDSRWAKAEDISRTEPSSARYVQEKEAEKPAENKTEKSAVLSGPSSLSSRWATADDTYRAERGLPATRYNARMKAREANSYLHSDHDENGGDVVVRKARETHDSSNWRAPLHTSDWWDKTSANTFRSSSSSSPSSSYRNNTRTAPSDDAWPGNRDRYRDLDGSSSWRSGSSQTAGVRPWDQGKVREFSDSSSWRSNRDNMMASSQWSALRSRDQDRYQDADNGSPSWRRQPSSSSFMESSASSQATIQDTPQQYEVEPEEGDWPTLPASEEERAAIQEQMDSEDKELLRKKMEAVGIRFW
ncbi:hypothetical protein BCR43DRAFT_505559 [Syncephalastrum racemosum]|uniref:Uncharacterized protein n=1 Tax=Syncephalastrum racemosum TaxID=13706 RepID=A0A1X2HEK3_SYNRA|nr:hypothetical protein BCR43DRAFT_505559 [Syncephalastrum racemosum]